MKILDVEGVRALIGEIKKRLALKQDAEPGRQLTEENYTAADKEKLESLDLSEYVKNTDYAIDNRGSIGFVKGGIVNIDDAYGIGIRPEDHVLDIRAAVASDINAEINVYKPLVSNSISSFMANYGISSKTTIPEMQEQIDLIDRVSMKNHGYLNILMETPDFNRVTESGIYQFSNSPANNPNSDKNDEYGILFVMANGGYVSQICHVFNNVNGSYGTMYFRSSSNSGTVWRTWHKFECEFGDHGYGIVLEANADLNELTAPGVYTSKNKTISTTILNTPFEEAGFRLEVKLPSSTDGFCMQILYPNQWTLGKYYIRNNNANNPTTPLGWGNWYEYSGAVVPTLRGEPAAVLSDKVNSVISEDAAE